MKIYSKKGKLICSNYSILKWSHDYHKNFITPWFFFCFEGKVITSENEWVLKQKIRLIEEVGV